MAKGHLRASTGDGFEYEFTPLGEEELAKASPHLCTKQNVTTVKKRQTLLEESVAFDVELASDLLSEALDEWRWYRTHPDYAEILATAERLLTTDVFAKLAEAQDLLECASANLEKS